MRCLCVKIVDPETVTTVGSKVVGVFLPSERVGVVTGVWNVLGSSETVALAVAGITARTSDSDDLWGGEENVGEGRLESLAVWCVENGVVGVGVLKLDPDFLDGSELSHMEFIVRSVHSTDGQDVSAHIVSTAVSCDGGLCVGVVAVKFLARLSAPAGAFVGAISTFSNTAVRAASSVTTVQGGRHLHVTVCDVTVGVLWTGRCNLDGRLIDNDLVDHIGSTSSTVSLTPAIVDMSNVFWEGDLDTADGIEEVGVCRVRGGWRSGSSPGNTVTHGMESSEVEPEVLSELVVWEGGDGKTSVGSRDPVAGVTLGVVAW